MRVDCEYPGGNILIESLEEDTVHLRQDLRDTEGDWFYWNFRVRGAEGRTVTFHFTGSDVIGVRGPALSLDGGASWRWLGRACVTGKSFQYAFPKDAREARFAVCIPYLEADLRKFLITRPPGPHLALETLCADRKGRQVELLRAGALDGNHQASILITARHHSCESMPNFAIEGMLHAILSDDRAGCWLRKRIQFLIIPFMDKDGVEEGDQGKNRRPHDHNRDYAQGLYPTVRALQALDWNAKKLRLALDLHCPGIRGKHHEEIYFVGKDDPRNQAEADAFAAELQRVRRGPLPYLTSDNLPFGQAWNTYTGPERSFGRWAKDIRGILCAASLEIPYANARGVEVTAETAREFGKDLAGALHAFLERRL